MREAEQDWKETVYTRPEKLSMRRSESSVWIRDNFSNASVCRVNGSGLSTNGWTSSRGDIFCMASRSATAEIKANRIDVTEVLRCEIVEFVTLFHALLRISAWTSGRSEASVFGSARPTWCLPDSLVAPCSDVNIADKLRIQRRRGRQRRLKTTHLTFSPIRLRASIEPVYRQT